MVVVITCQRQRQQFHRRSPSYNKYHDLLHGGAGKLLTLALDMEKALNKALRKAGLLQE